jgi:hypothetical protein
MNTKTTKALMIEAGMAGDWLTVALCEVALGERGWTTIDGRRYGRRRAEQAVAAIIAAAEARND